MGNTPEQASLTKADSTRDPNRILVEQPHLIDEALAEGVRDALLRHQQRGLPVVTELDGQIVWVSAEELLSK